MREMIDKVKNFRQSINEQYKLEDDGNTTFYSNWINEKDYDTKRKRFVLDTKEYLTGFFGTVGFKNEHQIMKRLVVIFDYAMNKIHDHGIYFLKDNGEYKTQIFTIAKYLKGDEDTVYSIIDGVFNQE